MADQLFVTLKTSVIFVVLNALFKDDVEPAPLQRYKSNHESNHNINHEISNKSEMSVEYEVQTVMIKEQRVSINVIKQIRVGHF